ncbi:MAG: TonB-dependent receptor [Rikenellaceae bacterium]
MLLFLMVASSVTLHAQGGISGVVVDSAGEPIIGATVIVDGTTMGTVTSIDGDFILNVKEGSQITVSFIGYNDVSTPLKNGMKIVMVEDSTQIEELVVIGYGVAKKETLTGSIAMVSDEVLSSKGSVTNPLSALQGQVPGVFVTRSSSAPGNESWSMNLRGQTSLNSSDPLVIIDGFACSSVNEMRLLNPNDIESMSFLKDGAAAIYGSDAAAGVILITTKKGSAGKVTVEYSASATYKYLGNSPELMSVTQWAENTLIAAESSAATGGTVLTEQWTQYLEAAATWTGGIIASNQTTSPLPSWSAVSDLPLFSDTDWYDSLWGDTWSTSNNVSFSGGNERVTYRMSFGYLYDGSQLQLGNNSNQRYNIRSNTSYKLTDKVTWDSSISYDRELNVTPSDISSALTTNIAQPGLPLTNINGDAYSWGTWASPYGQLVEGGDNNLRVDKLIINQSVNYKPTDWLTATVTGGYSSNIANRSIVSNAVEYYNYLGDELIMTSPSQENSSYVMTTGVTDNYSVSGYFNAVKTYNEVHDFSATLGGQYDFDEYTYYGIEAQDILESLEIVNGSGDVTIYSTNRWQTSTLSGFGRLNYAYDGRYLFEINGRYDGSSKFQAENRWDLFGGGSAAWRISEEAFMKSATWLTNLKLRFSYSEMGTQAGIGNYDGVQLYNLVQGSGAYIGDSYISYIKTNGTFASTTRQWERINNSNIGIDFGFFDGRLSGTFDVYRKMNNNMLISVDLPSTLGDSAPSSNAGVFRAQGWEGSLNYRGRIGEDFNYNIGATVSYTEDKLISYEGTSVLTSGYTSTQVGYGMNSLFGFQYAGKFETQEEADAYYDIYYDTNNCNMPSTMLRAGDNILVDVNEDGRIDEDDIVYLGSDNAPFSFSLSLGFDYKGFDLSAIFQGVTGRVVYNGITPYTVPTRAVYTGSTTASIGNVWSLDNTDAYYSPYTLDSNINNYNYQASSLTAQDASYLRLKNLSAGYTFPASSFGNCGINSLRVYVTGTDLWEISNMEDGFDPESAYQATGTERYPFMRSVSVGLNLIF